MIPKSRRDSVGGGVVPEIFRDPSDSVGGGVCSRNFPLGLSSVAKSNFYPTFVGRNTLGFFRYAKNKDFLLTNKRSL